MITLVTTTRDRAVCFSILEKWMERQTLKWDQWLVVNDGREPYTYTMGQEIINRDPSKDTFQSIRHNWLEAVPHIKGEKVFVIEDDDYYHPRFLETLAAALDEAELVGVAPDFYYMLPQRRYQNMRNTAHASLACTAFRKCVLPHMQGVASVFNSVFLDMYLWAEWGSDLFPGTKKLLKQPLPDGKMLHVGMKNMPGAAGLGMGHRMHGERPDGALQKLREWTGADAAVYRKLWQDHFEPPRR
jgi:hypothetical protein